MRKFGNTFLLIIFIGVILAFSSAPVRTQAQKYITYNPCDTPIEYKLGEVDSNFGLSNKQVLSDITEATNLWSKTEGKKLFVYNPSAKLTVNFTYDQRSALNSSIQQLRSKLNSQDASLKQEIDQYYADVQAFKQKLNDLNATIEKYNSEGGAPPDVYEGLVKQQEQLRQEGQALNNRAKQLNLETQNYNGNVHTLRQDVNSFNSALAQKPEEGLFDPLSDTVTIYFVNTHDELIHTLAHEFGHALGIQHINNPNAIMYPSSTESITVTADDKQELALSCQDELITTYWIEELQQWSQTHFNQ